jgi:hypothetical protein
VVLSTRRDLEKPNRKIDSIFFMEAGIAFLLPSRASKPGSRWVLLAAKE